jgi:hypothetical protein
VANLVQRFPSGIYKEKEKQGETVRDPTGVGNATVIPPLPHMGYPPTVKSSREKKNATLRNWQKYFTCKEE